MEVVIYVWVYFVSIFLCWGCGDGQRENVIERIEVKGVRELILK